MYKTHLGVLSLGSHVGVESGQRLLLGLQERALVVGGDDLGLVVGSHVDCSGLKEAREVEESEALERKQRNERARFNMTSARLEANLEKGEKGRGLSI